MQNPFTAHQQFESKPKRNAFDNSHRCFMTGKLGCLYPVLNLEVSAGDSVQIDSSFLFNFFPMVFPVQTPLRASIYFFYGRNRIFWKNWMDFAYNNKQPSHPFILQPQGSFWKTGELADFLGVPTTYTSLGVSDSYLPLRVPPSVSRGTYRLMVPTNVGVYQESFIQFSQPFFTSQDSNIEEWFFNGVPAVDKPSAVLFDKAFSYEDLKSGSFDLNDVPDGIVSSSSAASCMQVIFAFTPTEDSPVPDWQRVRPVLCRFAFESSEEFAKFDLTSGSWFDGSSYGLVPLDVLDALAPYGDRFYFGLVFSPSVNSFMSERFDLESPQPTIEGYFSRLVSVFGQSETVDLSVLSSNPFSGTSSNLPVIPLNAIPFRFYEAVYNAYFRNERNDPFVVNGEIEYNKWNTTLEDGADSTPYKLYFRNWEADFLTTATQTPQQGLAPLVGINVRGDMEFLNEDGTISRIRPTIADDGTTITGIAGVVENGTKAAMRSAMELITSGISINDFRQVSSLQSWLENNLRKGLKYKDQVAANTGVKIRYDELDMPEFIGGFSRPVQVTSITQATPSTAVDNALGDRAGQASVFGGSNHKISHYCDEAGYIMAIMCVYPQPVYTQLLPKYFLKSDALSYYHPQFGSIGLQPISYREVCPVQVFQESGDLDATFGYQRPWYDLIANVDEAHGNMRTNMRDYLMHRTFAGIPKLGRDFLKIDPEQLNDVFTITDGTEDVYQGQIAFNIFTKRAIPRFGIPRQI